MKVVKMPVEGVSVDFNTIDKMPGVYVMIGADYLPYALFKSNGMPYKPLIREEEEIERWIGENLREDLKDVVIYIRTKFQKTPITMREKKINNFIKDKILEINEHAVVEYKEEDVEV